MSATTSPGVSKADRGGSPATAWVNSAAKPRILLVCCPGGHLQQMFALERVWRDAARSWVTLSTDDSRSMLADEPVVYGRGPTTRNFPNFLRNLKLAFTIVRRDRPDVILSTGAALAVPFFIVGRLFGARLVYVQSLTRVNGQGLTGHLVYPLCDAYFVQWPKAGGWRKRVVYAGGMV